MKIITLFFLIIVTFTVISCATETNQFRSKTINKGLKGGFRANESLEYYDGAGFVRRGKIEETGDYYTYSPNGSIEIIPVEAKFLPDPNIIIAPKRVGIGARCNKDRISDRLKCHLNILPKYFGPGLHQIIDLRGNIISSCIIGHDFPGRKGAIRVDNRPAIITDNEGCLQGSKVKTLQNQLINGQRLIIRYVEWPYDYSKDKEMLISGSFSTALELYRWSVKSDLASLFK